MIPCENCNRRLTACHLLSKASEEKPKIPRNDNKYILQLERLVLAKYPLLTLKNLKKNIDLLERAEITRMETPLPDNEDTAKLPMQMAATSDQSFITFMNSELPMDDYYHRVEKVSKNLLYDSIALLPSLERMKKLAHVFFDVCETNFFYLHPRKFFEEIDDLYINITNMTYVNENWEFLVHVLGVLSIAVNYEYIKDDVLLLSTSEDYIWDDPGYKYFLQMLHFVGLCMYNNSLESIKTFQLMGVYMTTKRVDVLSRCVDHGYRCLNIAVEIAINNKFHLENSYIHKPKSDQEFIKRLWWSCYTLERRLAFNLGKPELIKPSNITVSLPLADPSLNHMDGTSNSANQTAVIEIIKIFGEISAMMYCSNEETSVTVQTKTVRNISLKLDKWQEKVNNSRKSQTQVELQQLKYRANKHLDLFYYLGKIYLGKPFLLYQLENHNAIDLKTDTPQNTFIHYMTSICVDSAFNIFDILTQMKDDNKLGVYSSTDLNFCNLGLFVTVVFLKIDSSPSVITFLKKGLSILKELSKGSSSAKVNRSMFSKFDNLDITEAPTPFSVNRGEFPDWDLDLQAQDFLLSNMGVMFLPDITNLSNNEFIGYNLYEDFSSRYFGNDENGNSENID